MFSSPNGGLHSQKSRMPMGDLAEAGNKPLHGAISRPPSPPGPIKPKFCCKLDYSIDEYMKDLHGDFLCSAEKKTMLLLQFQALRDKANYENTIEHSNRCMTLRHGETVQLFQNLCEELRLNYIVRMRAIETYDRLMAILLEEDNTSVSTLTPQEKEKVKTTIEKDTMLRICSCIQLVLKFHFDKDDEGLNNFKLQDVLAAKSFDIETDDIKQSEMRVYRSLDYQLNFVTSLDVIENLVPILDNNDLLDMQKTYQMCMRIIDFIYLSHGKIYKRFCESKIFASLSRKGYPVKRLESDVILRGAVALSSAFFFINSNEDRSKELADLCCIPQKIIFNFSAIIIDELLLN